MYKNTLVNCFSGNEFVAFIGVHFLPKREVIIGRHNFQIVVRINSKTRIKSCSSNEYANVSSLSRTFI